MEKEKGHFRWALWKRKWSRTFLKQPAEEGGTEINTKFFLETSDDERRI